MSQDIDMPRRRDADGDFHELAPGICENCGCTFFFAVDDGEVVWDPGEAWDPTCTDRTCRCHVAALIGERRA